MMRILVWVVILAGLVALVDVANAHANATASPVLNQDDAGEPLCWRGYTEAPYSRADAKRLHWKCPDGSGPMACDEEGR